MLYRVVETILRGSGDRLYAGSISDLEGVKPKVIRLLLKKNRIAEVKAPPLAIIPKFAERAELLAPLGIINVVDLIEADHREIADQLGIDLKGLRASVKEARKWLDPQEDDGSGAFGWQLHAK